MTNYIDNEGYPISRRDVLKSATAAGLVGIVGIPAVSGSAFASSHAAETLYLTDSGGDNGGNFLTKLYSVDLDASVTPPRANLQLLVELTDGDFDQVDAIAATPDGSEIHMVDKNSKHLGRYDVGAGTFSDGGAIAGLPGGVVLATYSLDGTFYVASQSNNTIYTVDPSGPSASPYVTVSGANVQGADLAFDSAGTLYLYSSGAQTLYTVDYDSTSPTFGEATFVGETGDFFTGLAVRDDGAGDLVGSNTTRDEIVVVDKGTGAQGTAFEMYLDDDRYAYGYGDMTVGALEPECVTCEDAELLAKYEFECVDHELVDDEEVCVEYDFVFETGTESLVSYQGSYETNPGEAFEPVSADFATEYCSVWQVVKAGQDFVVAELTASDGSVTASNGDSVHAISFVAFFCTEEAAQAFADSFPSKGRGGGKPGR